MRKRQKKKNFIKEISVLKLEKDDLLLIKIANHCNAEQAIRISNTFKKYIKNNEVIVMRDIEIKRLRGN